MTGIQCGYIRVRNIRPLCEFTLEPFDRILPVASINPVNKAKNPEVLAAKAFFLGKAEFFNRFQNQLGNINFQNGISVQRLIFKRIGKITGFLEITICESTTINDDHAARLEPGKIDHQSCRV